MVTQFEVTSLVSQQLSLKLHLPKHFTLRRSTAPVLLDRGVLRLAVFLEDIYRTWPMQFLMYVKTLFVARVLHGRVDPSEFLVEGERGLAIVELVNPSVGTCVPLHGRPCPFFPSMYTLCL